MNTPVTLTTLALTLLLGACDPGLHPAEEKPLSPTPATRREPAAALQEGRLAVQHEAPPRSAKSERRERAGLTAQGFTRRHQTHHQQRTDRERYAHFDDNPLKITAETPASTFSIDVDTGSYANLRRILNEGRLPPADAVRTEELLNYFSYDDPAPAQRERPFLTTTEIASTPWNPHTHLLRIGIKAWEIDTRELPPANLVFLLDVSGSMDSPDKLPLLKRAMSLLSKHLDGDFNVGTVNHQALIDLVERQRGAGIALTTLGFGGGNYNDQLMEQLADHGNGNHAYIDSLLEAQKVLVDEMGATLHTLAGDVKIQIEFNPAQVAEYRLIGYENRALRREDFNNDEVDAGEIGAGHSVTALYEIALSGGAGRRTDPLRYAPATPGHDRTTRELALLRLRYKTPDQTRSRLIETPLRATDVQNSLEGSSDDFRFSAAVAAFGQRLRGGTYLNGFDYPQIAALAAGARGTDPMGHRGDLLRLVRLAHGLQGRR
ncbi:MAG: DUF3520 domain-containing protein [gamma proteobacterium symbiont of Phacoides pectinatus]